MKDKQTLKTEDTLHKLDISQHKPIAICGLSQLNVSLYVDTANFLNDSGSIILLYLVI